MFSSTTRRFLARAGLLAVAFAGSEAIAAPANPGFESNGGVGTPIFTSWTVVDFVVLPPNQPNASGNAYPNPAPNGGGGGVNSWVVQTGTTTPTSAQTVAAPPEGTYAAMSDQTGPTSSVLYQDIVIPTGGASIAFDLYLDNLATDWVSPPTLDPSAGPNQQFRADLVSTAADPFDVGSGVLQNLYQTQPGDPLVSGYTRITVPVSASLAGQTVRLRFAQVDNQLFLHAGVDAVAVVAGGGGATVAVPAPTLDTRMLAILALVLGLGALVTLRRS